MRSARTFAAAAVIAAVLAGCAGQDRRPEVIIQAHRGAGSAAPENTLESFGLAWWMGAVPEADVRASRDGVLVALHDENFKRLVKDAPAGLQSKGVEDLAWAELSRLDVGAYAGRQFAGQRIARIEEVFAAMSGRPSRLLYLDIKKVDLGQLAAMASRYRVRGQLVLASPKHDLICEWKRLSPESGSLLWIGGTPAQIEARFEAARSRGFESLTQLQIHVTAGDPSAADPFSPSSDFLRGVAAALAPRGILFQNYVMGRAEPWAFTRLMGLGVQSFATDSPQTALKVAREHRRAGGKEAR